MRYFSRLLAPDAERVTAERREMLQDLYVLDEAARPVALAAHVRSNHVHMVVEAETRPEKMMNEFKSYASRELNQLTSERPDRRRWARHASTRWLWKDEDVRQALQYVVDAQGEPMALFVADEL